MHEDILDTVGLGPSGAPYAYGPDGRPVTLREAAALLEDLEERTLRRTPMRLVDGQQVVLRTVCLVIDRQAATGMVPAGYRPWVWGAALYTPAPVVDVITVLAQYDVRQEAIEAHEMAMTAIALGQAGDSDVQGRSLPLAGLPWAGPG